MTNKSVFGICTAGALAVGFVGGFMGFPVFAEGPVDISIVEKVDDGAGGYRDWQDITGAMPGMSYSAIPVVKNNGELDTYVWMCLSQSVTDGSGGRVSPHGNIFDINIDSTWVAESNKFSNKYLGAENCYRYNSALEVGNTTEPIFNEVTLSPSLTNEYQNATFSLHLDAYAMDEIPEDSDDSVVVNPTAPSNPDTGAVTTGSEALSTAWTIALSLGLGALMIVVGLYIAKVIKQDR